MATLLTACRTGEEIETGSTAAGRRSPGFTLIEVLIAMVILSVGLLPLMAAGAHGLRMVGSADRQTERTVEATLHLERALLQLHRDRALADSSWTLPHGDAVQRTVTRSLGNTLWTVTLQLTPGPLNPSAQAVSVSSNVFLP